MLMTLLSAILLAFVFLLHCDTVGRAALRGLRFTGIGLPGANTGLVQFFSLCVGMLLNMAVLFALALIGQFDSPSISVAAAALIVISGGVQWAYARMDEGVDPPRGGRPVSMLEALFLAALFLLSVVVAMHPPGHWDDTMYQLPLARDIVEHHGLVLNEYLRFPLFPQYLNLLFALGLMLGESLPAGGAFVLAQVFASLPLFVMVMGLWAASRRFLGSGVPGMWAGMLLFLIGPVKRTLGFAYVDNGLALFCFAAALAIALGVERLKGQGRGVLHSDWDSGDHHESATVANAAAGGTTARVPVVGPPGASAGVDHAASPIALWILAGLMAGAAAGIKFHGVVYAVLLVPVISLAAWLLARASPDGAAGNLSQGPHAASVHRHPLKTAFVAKIVFGLTVLLVAGGWYLRSYLLSGDPFHPAGARFFGFFLWNEGDLAWQHDEQATYGVSKNPLLLPKAMVQAGVLPWILALLSLVLPRVPLAIRALQAVFVTYLLFWFLVTQVPRYLAPVYGVACLLSVYTLYAGWLLLRERYVRQTSSMVGANRRPRLQRFVAAALLVLAAGYTIDRGMKYAKEFADADRVLGTQPGSGLYRAANDRAAEYGQRLVQVGFENGIYFFNGTVIGDWFGPGRYRDTLACEAVPCGPPSWEHLDEILRRHDARLLMLSRIHVLGLDGALKHLPAGWELLDSNPDGVLLGIHRR